MSRFHLEGGGDLVWNVGTGYFGCGTGTMKRTFDEAMFRDNAQRDNCKMIELKLSQGAKPAHGGMLPRAKITPAIAEARGLKFPAEGDCNSPARHSAFDTPERMMHFIARLRARLEAIVARPAVFQDECMLAESADELLTLIAGL